jgi:hypothetical protein
MKRKPVHELAENSSDASAGVDIVLFALGWLDRSLDGVRGDVEAWARGRGTLTSARHAFVAWSNAHELIDESQRRTYAAMGEALEALARKDVVAICDAVIEIARWRDWDPALAEAAMRSAPTREYDEMERRREAAIDEVTEAVAAILERKR